MNVKTQAIVLHLSRISDKASVLHLYTREHGRVAYYVYGGKKWSQLLLPLTLLEVDAVHLDTREIQQIKDLHVAYVANQTTADICRQTEALFMAEILYRVLTHPLADAVLYDYLDEVVKELNTRPDPENIHLEFLVGFVSYLGFGIDADTPMGQQLKPLLEGQSISRSQRRGLLHSMMDYYKLHLPDFQEPKSLDVMTEVFA